ncbi:MAG: hypothetical protein JNN15_13980 [Blastocatellia bacterium]|nr:hypothetical protein [Blastocatellia bacterium]
MTNRSNISGSGNVVQFWLFSNETNRGATIYHPAVLVECKLTFRSLRASIHHTDERHYTAFYPEGELPVDWDIPAITIPTGTKLASAPPTSLPHKEGNYRFVPERIAEMEEELISRLVRKEKLALYYNPYLKTYSTPGETKEDFLRKVSEKGIVDLEPELKELMRRFEMKIEQVREAEERKGRHDSLPDPDLITMIEKRSELLTSKARLATVFSMFLNSAKTHYKPKRKTNPGFKIEHAKLELRETLQHIEQEASDAVKELCEEFLDRTTQCDTFEIGLQRHNIQVLRRAVLWIPT